jgi:hypothetical protein
VAKASIFAALPSARLTAARPPNPHQIDISKLGNCLHNCGRQGLECSADTSARVGPDTPVPAFDLDLCSHSISPRMAHSRIFWRCSAGHQAFLGRHEEIFRGMFRGTVLRQDVVSLRFFRPRGRRCENTYVDFGVFSIGSTTRRAPDAKARLRTRLLPVMVKQSGDSNITLRHNVYVKPAVTAPEPQRAHGRVGLSQPCYSRWHRLSPVHCEKAGLCS